MEYNFWPVWFLDWDPQTFGLMARSCADLALAP